MITAGRSDESQVYFKSDFSFSVQSSALKELETPTWNGTDASVSRPQDLLQLPSSSRRMFHGLRLGEG